MKKFKSALLVGISWALAAFVIVHAVLLAVYALRGVGSWLMNTLIPKLPVVTVVAVCCAVIAGFCAFLAMLFDVD